MAETTSRNKLKVRQLNYSSIYPVGHVYITLDTTNPVSRFGGTWTAIQGYTLVGHGGASPLNGNVGTTYGAVTHTLSEAEMPAHKHIEGFAGVNANASYGTTTAPSGNINSQSGQNTIYHPFTSIVGSGNAHNNVQPSFIVYMWRRTA